MAMHPMAFVIMLTGQDAKLVALTVINAWIFAHRYVRNRASLSVIVEAIIIARAQIGIRVCGDFYENFSLKYTRPMYKGAK